MTGENTQDQERRTMSDDNTKREAEPSPASAGYLEAGMATLAGKLRRIESVDRIPDGTYDGIWGGYRVTFEVEGVQYEAETLDGIRTPRASCTVTSKGGRIMVAISR
jgi:hypothetical protein